MGLGGSDVSNDDRIYSFCGYFTIFEFYASNVLF